MVEKVVNSHASVIGCDVGKWLMKYLGLWLGDNPRFRLFGSQFWAKCAKRLVGWQCALFSKGGRVTLIQ